MVIPWKNSSDHDHEAIFIERYQRVRGWLLQLTDHDQELTEDLLHDAFIHFTFTRPELSSIRNLDGYLYGLVRNLHISHLRRAAHNRFKQLSIIDYDSGEIGLRMIEPREQFQARDELRRVCQYACVRKETAWMGSVLILRFFHGYFPTEIAQILRSSRPSVDVMLRGARREAKLYLEKPAQLSFLKDKLAARQERPAAQASPVARHFAPATDDFLSELRGMIFHSRRGDCWPREQLRELYLTSSAEQIKCSELAHIVSCERCLEEVNELLGLSPLADRYPTASRDKDSRPGKGGGGGDTGAAGGGSGSSKEALLRKGRQRVREVFEHRPQELHITVNGLPHGSQRINSRLSEQTLDINLQTPISFIEVFSEQQLRLLFINVESPPEGPLQQLARIDLSEGRTLELMLKFSNPWPTLHTAYYDPTYLEDEEAELAGPLVSAPPALASAEPNAPDRDGLLKRCSRLAAGIQYPWRPWQLFGSSLWSRPGAVAVVCAVLLVAALLIARMQLFTPAVSAAELLRKSIATEGATASDVVLHCKISLEERSAAGDLLARRSVEVWQSSGKGVTARRLYDERGALVAGEWSRADGSSTLYRPGNKPQNLQASESQITAPRGLDDAWQLELSAKDFVALIGRADGARVEELPSAYAISFLGDAARDGLVRARLILARDNLRAIEQMLLVKLGAGEMREYRFVETGFEKQPSAAVRPAVFDPNPELLGAPNVTLENGERKLPATLAAPATVATPNPAPVKAAATAQLEVEALSALSRIGADLGEEVSVRRSPGAALQIESIVGTEQRKQEILLALKPFAADPAVEVRVETAAEAAQRSQRNQSARPRESTVIVREAETSGAAIPVHREVRRYLSGKGTPDEQLDVEVNRFASQTLRRSHRAALRVWALRTLIRRFSPSDLQALNAEARAKWLAMIGEHAREFQRETELMRTELSLVFTAAQSPSANEAVAEITDDPGLLRAIGCLIELGSANDEAIRASFNISSGGASDGASFAVRTPQFWHSLQLAEQWAAAIRRAKI